MIRWSVHSSQWVFCNLSGLGCLARTRLAPRLHWLTPLLGSNPGIGTSNSRFADIQRASSGAFRPPSRRWRKNTCRSDGHHSPGRCSGRRHGRARSVLFHRQMCVAAVPIHQAPAAQTAEIRPYQRTAAHYQLVVLATTSEVIPAARTVPGVWIV